jgi:hypothetical protein
MTVGALRRLLVARITDVFADVGWSRREEDDLWDAERALQQIAAMRLEDHEIVGFLVTPFVPIVPEPTPGFCVDIVRLSDATQGVTFDHFDDAAGRVAQIHAALAQSERMTVKSRDAALVST